MSDGLFQPDPPCKPRFSLTKSPTSASVVSQADGSTQESMALPKDEPLRESAYGRDGDHSGNTSDQSSAVAAQEPSDQSSTTISNESPTLRGLWEEQPLHRPGTTATTGPSEAIPSEYVPPEQTEAPWSFRVIGWLYSAFTGPTAIALAVGFAGLLALYIYFQVLSLVATLTTLPTWLGAIAVILLSLLIGVVLLALGRLIIVYSRLRRNEQIRMSDIAQLQRHAEIRRGCNPSQKRQHAKAVLESYVREYPEYETRKTWQRPTEAATSSVPGSCSFRTSLFSDEHLTRLCRARRRLADPARVKDSKEWLQIYATEFQGVLDAAARDRVHQCAKWVGVKTAISPNALVDTLITAYWCFVLLRDLCMIYNLRVGVYGTAALLWRAFFAAYLAGQFQDWEEHADYTIESMIDGLPEIGRNVVGKLAAKAGTGLANYFLVRRLGRRAIALLKPLDFGATAARN